MVNWIGLYTFIRRELERMLRVAIQTLVTPWISALLYIFVFGSIIGKRIDLIAGVQYIDFVLPGILMMNVIMSSFSHSSSSLYFARFIRSIEEILVAPFSYAEMIIGYVLGAVLRGLIVGLGVFVISVLFSAANLQHLGLFIFYTVAVSIIFALLGMLVGLWAKGFEQLGILSTFIITPLSFLGGIFYSVDMLPESIRGIAYYNPFFYFVDGIRYSMIGIQEGNPWVGLAVIMGSIVVLGGLVWTLFNRGWRLRE